MVACRQHRPGGHLSTDPRQTTAIGLRLAAAAVGSATLAHPHWTIDTARCILDGAAEVLERDPWSNPQRVALASAITKALEEVPKTGLRHAEDVGRGVASLVWLIRGWVV